jgi:hypothetical protein
MKLVALILVLCALLVGCTKIKSLFAPAAKPTVPRSRSTEPRPDGAWFFVARTNTEKTDASPAAKRSAQKDLENLGVYLMAQVERTGRPAGSLQDATVLAEQDPALHAQVKAGIYVVRWGIEPKAFGAAVIAYEAQTPTKGGYVLLGGANVAKATPEEFKSALNNRD